MKKKIRIKNIFIIAEISSNHNNNFLRTKKLIKAISKTGVDAVKFQTFEPDEMTLNTNNRNFKINEKKSLWKGRKLFDLYNQYKRVKSPKVESKKALVDSAKSSIDSASFHREPLVYSFSEEKKITNELEVVAFIHKHNTEQARLKRAELNSEVTAPAYKTITKLSRLTKLNGPCTRTEISALTPMMQFYLSSILIDKIKVQ